MAGSPINIKKAIDSCWKLLTSSVKAAKTLENIKASTLLGVTGLLTGVAGVLVLNSWIAMPLLPALPIAAALGTAIGHVIFKGMTGGFRAAAESEAERQRKADLLEADRLRKQHDDRRAKAQFDEGIRRIEALKKVAAPELIDAAVIKLLSTSIGLNDDRILVQLVADRSKTGAQATAMLSATGSASQQP